MVRSRAEGMERSGSMETGRDQYIFTDNNLEVEYVFGYSGIVFYAGIKHNVCSSRKIVCSQCPLNIFRKEPSWRGKKMCKSSQRTWLPGGRASSSLCSGLYSGQKENWVG